MKVFYKASLLFIIIAFTFQGYAQNLTISTSGETTSPGTNWSITGNTLNVAASGTANVHPSVITNHLTSTGDLTIILPFSGADKRDMFLNNSISYTGSNPRTLTFNISNDIIMASGANIISSNSALNIVMRTALSTSNVNDIGRIQLDGITITTNGGHFWAGGGFVNTTWNNLEVGNGLARTWNDDIPGLSISNSTLNTNGGHVYLAGLSYDTSDDNGLNHGVLIDNSTIASASGNIEIRGDLRGRFTNGYGTAIFSSTGTTAITATTGSINIRGDGFDQVNNGNGWRVGMMLNSTSVTNSLRISTISGNILLEGNANFAATVNDKEGLVIFGSGLGIVSQTGNLNIKGSNTLETSGQFSNSIRFQPHNITNAIRIGFDGTNAYSGNIIIEGNSIYQRDNWSGSGSIAVQTTGTLTIQPTGNAFTYMRAGNSGTLTYDNDWNFGTNLGGFTLGKTTNLANITLSSNIAVNGPIAVMGGFVSIDANLTSSANGDILIKGISSANPSILVHASRTINKSSGTGTLTLQGHARVSNSGTISATGTGKLNVIMWSDFDNSNNDGGVVSSGNISTQGGHIWLGGSNSNGGSYTWNGLTVGDGPSIGSTNYNNNPLDISFAQINTSNGHVFAWAGNGIGGNALVVNNNTSINAGTGNITLMADEIYTLSTFPLTTTGKISLVPDAGSYASAITLGGSVTSGNLRFNTHPYNGLIINSVNTLGGLTIGRTEELLSSGNPVVFDNLSDVTITATGMNVAGPISVFGGTIVVNENLNTTTGTTLGDILLKSSANITLAASKSITTAGGDVILWSDSDASGQGAICIGNSTGSASIVTNGGNITLSGGSNIATDYASSSVGFLPWGGKPFAGISIFNATLDAQGGDIVVRGALNNQIESVSGRAILVTSGIIKTNGVGTISVNGTAGNFAGANPWGIVLETASAIETGSGNINITGKGSTLSANARGMVAGASNIQSASGEITFIDNTESNSANYNGIYISGTTKFGKGSLASSSSNIIISADKIQFDGSGNDFTTSGQVTLESFSNSFANALTFPIANLSLANTVSGLTLGKSTNTQNITFGGVTTIAGPITAYGGSIAVNAAITAAGNILLDGDTGSFLTQNTKGVTSTAAITTSNNGNITILGRGGSGTGYNANHGIDIRNIVEAGGTGIINIVGYGGLSSNGTGSSCHGVLLEVSNASWVKSNGGNVTINGFGGGASNGSFSIGVPIINNSKVSAAGAGAITITGTGGVNTVAGLRGVVITASSSVFSAGGAITITGINGTNGLDYSDGVYFDNALIGSNASGAITISGQAGTGISNALLMNTSNTIGGASHANNITLRGNNMSLSGTNSVLTTGQVTIEPSSDSFASAITFPITNLSIANTITGLTIGKPTNTSNLTFANATTIAGPITAYGANININSNLKTNNSGAMHLKGNTTIAAGNHIESNGNFTHDGNMTFKSDATGTAAFGPLGGTYTTTSGTVTVERYIPAKRAFRFLTSAVTTTGSSTIRTNWQNNGVNTAGLGTHITGTGAANDGFDVTASNSPSMFTYTNGAWAPVTSTLGVLTAGTPYRLMVRGDRTISLATNNPTATPTTLRATGALRTGNFTPALNQAADGFSLIGNPYQAPIDIKAILTASTNMSSNVVYYWDPTLNARGGYVTRNLTTDVNDVTSNFNQYVQPGQAVFVKNTSTGNPTMTISETHKAVTSGAAGVFRSAASVDDAVGLLRVKLQANINNQWQLTDGALAIFNENYSWNVTDEDATKMGNLDEEVSFMLDGTALAIALQNQASVASALPIQINKMRHTDYQWTFDLDNYNGLTPMLWDEQNQTMTAMTNNTVVPFSTTATATDRFKIVFQETMNIDDFSLHVALYPNPGKSNQSFYLSGVTDAKVSIQSLLVQEIPVTTSLNGQTMEVKPETVLSTGVYFVSITQAGKTAQVKWIVE